MYITRPFQVRSGSVSVELENIVVDKCKTLMTRGYFFSDKTFEIFFKVSSKMEGLASLTIIDQDWSIFAAPKFWLLPNLSFFYEVALWKMHLDRYPQTADDELLLKWTHCFYLEFEIILDDLRKVFVTFRQFDPRQWKY